MMANRCRAIVCSILWVACLGDPYAKSAPESSPQSSKPVLLTASEIADLGPIESITKRAERLLAQRGTRSLESASRQFGDLLLELNCVGRSIHEVRAVLGRPDTEEANSISYLFDAGFGGWVWKLRHEGTKILAVEMRGTN
jgi:hypothetical protein